MKYDYMYCGCKSIEKMKENFNCWFVEWKQNKIDYINELIEIAQEDLKESDIPLLISVRKTVRNFLPYLSNCHSIEDILQVHEVIEKLVNIELSLCSTYEIE